MEIKPQTKVETAIILAAGRGSRMGPATEECPKCLVKLAGRPLLEWQINALRSAGISEIIVVAGYKSQLIKCHDVKIVENHEWQSSNMVVSLLYASPHIIQPTIVSYSDIVYGKEAVECILEYPGELVLAYDPNWLSLWSERFSDPLSDAESFMLDNGMVREIGRKCTDISEIQGQYMGLFKITPVAMAWIDSLLTRHLEKRNILDMTALIRELIAEGRAVYGVPVKSGWCEIDTASDLDVAQSRLTRKLLELDSPV